MSRIDRSLVWFPALYGTELRCSSGSLPCRGEVTGLSSGLASSLSRLDRLRFKMPKGLDLPFLVDDWGEAAS